MNFFTSRTVLNFVNAFFIVDTFIFCLGFYLTFQIFVASSAVYPETIVITTLFLTAFLLVTISPRDISTILDLIEQNLTAPDKLHSIHSMAKSNEPPDWRFEFILKDFLQKVSVLKLMKLFLARAIIVLIFFIMLFALKNDRVAILYLTHEINKIMEEIQNFETQKTIDALRKELKELQEHQTKPNQTSKQGDQKQNQDQTTRSNSEQNSGNKGNQRDGIGQGSNTSQGSSQGSNQSQIGQGEQSDSPSTQNKGLGDNGKNQNLENIKRKIEQLKKDLRHRRKTDENKDPRDGGKSGDRSKEVSSNHDIPQPPDQKHQDDFEDKNGSSPSRETNQKPITSEEGDKIFKREGKVDIVGELNEDGEFTEEISSEPDRTKNLKKENEFVAPKRYKRFFE
ncbi:MAG: hypothetical protein NZO16_03220 [Deltaproteobacteria bacterium]|nr:hypothetical protein [Deltaproteobacteria bacterium]